MNDRATPVSLGKSATPAASGAKGGSAATTEPPKYVRYAVIALAVSATFALVTTLSLYGLKGWLFTSATKANNKRQKVDQKTAAELHHAVSNTVTGQLVATIVVMIALGLAARAVWQGRYWARWAVFGLWVLATFTSTFAGFTYIVTVATSEPLAFKLPAFVSSVAFLVAVIMVSLRPSTQYFNKTRPVRTAAGAAPRRTLFTPRDPVRAARLGHSAPGATPPARNANNRAQQGTDDLFRGDTNTERSRAKQRANAEAVSRGADLARARAKQSKSRRTGV